MLTTLSEFDLTIFFDPLGKSVANSQFALIEDQNFKWSELNSSYFLRCNICNATYLMRNFSQSLIGYDLTAQCYEYE